MLICGGDVLFVARGCIVCCELLAYIFGALKKTIMSFLNIDRDLAVVHSICLSIPASLCVASVGMPYRLA